MVWWLVYAALALLALRLFVIFFLRSKRKPSAQARKALIVLGSGGHSTEMLQLLASVNRDQLSPRCYLLANTDAGSISLAKEFEGDRSDYSFVRIQRSREVGEKTLSSVRNTLSATKQAFGHIWRIWPDIIICNGPGTCVPVCAVALLYRLLWIKDISIIYVESFARVTELSRSGKLLYPFVDRFFVMWPDLAKQRLFNIFRRRVEVVTLLPRAVFDRGDVIRSPSTGKRVFVTVGSTKFDELIRCIDTPETQRALEVINCSSLSVQFGNGSYQPTFSSGPQESIINCFAFRYKPSLEDEVANADVVICHAGSGSVLQALKHRKRCIVVPNESLQDNHQVQLAEVLCEQGVVTKASPKTLATTIRTLSARMPPRLDVPDLSTFAAAVKQEAGIA